MSTGSGVPELNIGVLCIQGAFIEHVQALEKLAKEKREVFDIKIVNVRKPAQLSGLDGLIIPGGESTTLSVFLSKNGFEEALRHWILGEAGRGLETRLGETGHGDSSSPGSGAGPGPGGTSPRARARPGVLWGTCAGLILIANTLTEQKKGGQVTVRGGC